MSCPGPRTTPCACGCGVVLHQKAKGTPRKVWNAACEKRLAAKREAEREAAREARRLKARALGWRKHGAPSEARREEAKRAALLNE